MNVINPTNLLNPDSTAHCAGWSLGRMINPLSAFQGLYLLEVQSQRGGWVTGGGGAVPADSCQALREGDNDFWVPGVLPWTWSV